MSLNSGLSGSTDSPSTVVAGAWCIPMRGDTAMPRPNDYRPYDNRVLELNYADNPFLYMYAGYYQNDYDVTRQGSVKS